jgi:hypothetical protein
MGLCLLFVSGFDQRDALAVQVTYGFSTTVSFVNSGADGFPASLSGVSVNDPITGTIQYEAESPAAANPFPGGVFALATYYPLQNVTVSINVAGAVFDSWAGTTAALVWNNDPTSVAPPGVYDGLLYLNIPSPQDTRFKIGNFLLPSDSFADDALPGGPVAGMHLLELGLPNSPWIDSNPLSLTQVLAPPPVTGDFDGDGIVDQGDYDVWLATFGSMDDLRADANGDGVVDAADYTIWRDHLELPQGLSARSTSSNAAVPEPANDMLLLFGCFLIFCCLAPQHLGIDRAGQDPDAQFDLCRYLTEPGFQLTPAHQSQAMPESDS